MAIKNWFYSLVLCSALFLMLLGGWWLYLVFKLAHKLEALNTPSIQGNLINMIKWEGASFILLLFIIVIFLIYFYIIDHKKTKSIQEFFASFTHELKTPLASIKLQTQVICELLNQDELKEDQRKQLNTFASRLIQDGHKLEDQLDNHLQLSRIERNAPISLSHIDLKSFIPKQVSRFSDLPNVEIISTSDEYLVHAEYFSLETIIRNLLENTLNHNPKTSKISFELLDNPHGKIIYKDFGGSFKGDLGKLKKLFYKYNSPNGTGIGLYLIDNLMKKKSGKFNISEGIDGLEFILQFKVKS